MAGASELTLLAPAKVNLTLRVTGRQAGGMHELDAPTVPLALADTVTVTRRHDRRCINAWRLQPPAPGGELGLRAARLLARAAGGRHGVTIHVDKHIPAGAGLGGGSSDAAAVLLACNRLWDLHWPLARLARLGGELGADVPFFVYCRQARIGGTGSRLTRLAHPVHGWCVLLVPDFHCQTSHVFAEFDRQTLTTRAKTGRIAKYAFQHNDLLPAALRLHPLLGGFLHDLHRVAGKAGMSGSGGTCFAQVSSQRAGQAIAANLNHLAGRPGRVLVTRIMRGRVRKMMGSGQAVRQRILVPSCVGSNPTSPASPPTQQ